MDLHNNEKCMYSISRGFGNGSAVEAGAVGYISTHATYLIISFLVGLVFFVAWKFLIRFR